MRQLLNPGSLANRISLLMAVLLAASGIALGLAIYAKVKSALRNNLESRSLTRIAGLEASLEIEQDALILEENPAPVGAAESWRVESLDGAMLWQSHWDDAEGENVTIHRTVVIGASRPAAPSAKLAKIALIVDNKETEGYKLPPGANGVELRVLARMSTAPMHAELYQLAVALWTICPLVIFAAALLVSMFVRWQLRPLERMAAAAAEIGPQTLDARIGGAGSSVECAQLRDAINRMLDRLGEGLERERRFASMAAHELRTPLAQLRMNIEVTLRRPRNPDDYQRALADCLPDVIRLQTLIGNLLASARSGDSEVFAGERANLGAVLERAKQECGSNARIVDSTKLATDVFGNPDLLTSAFRNVLENAERYAPGAPPEIAGFVENGAVNIAIADAGNGIPEAERERIFRPLVRLEESRTISEKPGGFGLGLTIARSAVRACGGDLTCRARLDGSRGAEFVFTLKRAGNANLPPIGESQKS